ncbi:hypothetical protein K435DRAFT_791071 [Dendrothele bispora CBS 962.96]|uniref:Uncharacterized protein n=1 Tax=Dendrothele bispora (strain CBS 962.96) TaxID=1314807 RepID=A0A4S8MN31_DENBC|nr:hypothetical protein K435DRAFT_791071 [Dendrothele bispora CBS 962.96]
MLPRQSSTPELPSSPAKVKASSHNLNFQTKDILLQSSTLHTSNLNLGHKYKLEGTDSDNNKKRILNPASAVFFYGHVDGAGDAGLFGVYDSIGELVRPEIATNLASTLLFAGQVMKEEALVSNPRLCWSKGGGSRFEAKTFVQLALEEGGQLVLCGQIGEVVEAFFGSIL